MLEGGGGGKGNRKIGDCKKGFDSHRVERRCSASRINLLNNLFLNFSRITIIKKQGSLKLIVCREKLSM